MKPGAHIQEVGVLYRDARQQVELVGALGGVPGHVVRLDLDLSSAEASGHQKEGRGHGCYDKQQLQIHSISNQSAPTARACVAMCKLLL